MSQSVLWCCNTHRSDPYVSVFPLMSGYLEWARLEAGLADGDRTLPGEEYGEGDEAAARVCVVDDKKPLLFSDGDLKDRNRG